MAFDITDLRHKLDTKSVAAAVIGLGYVGLPLSCTMFSRSIKVIGLDIDPVKINKLRQGETYLDSIGAEMIKAAVNKKLFLPNTDFSLLTGADFIVICVPTPLDDEHKPDLSYVEDTARTIAKYLRPGHVVILESTTYPGTMRDVVVPLLEKESGLIHEEDFHVAYSPEREDPGNKHFKTGIIPKIVGANHPDARELTETFYRLFIEQVVPVSSMEVAEAAKITENVFRAVNIAFVNELKIIFDLMGLDVWEVIDAAKTKPFGYMPFYPGPGIGGHCIPIDPFYLSWKAEQLGQKTRFIELAGEINMFMTDYVLRKIEQALNLSSCQSLEGLNFLILGVAYKKNVDDQRESPAFPLMRKLKERHADVAFHDPHIPMLLPMREYPELSGTHSVDLNKINLKSYDAVLIITDHDDINYNLVAECSNLIVDTRNALRARNVTARNTVVRA